jgi:DNA-binding NarL/FixJ family response regulator
MTGRIRVAILSESRLFREAFSSCLAAEDQFEVVGQANTVHDLLLRAQGRPIDVLLVYAGIGPVRTREALWDVKTLLPASRVAFLGCERDHPDSARWHEADTMAWLGQDASYGSVREAIAALSEGRGYAGGQQPSGHRANWALSAWSRRRRTRSPPGCSSGVAAPFSSHPRRDGRKAATSVSRRACGELHPRGQVPADLIRVCTPQGRCRPAGSPAPRDQARGTRRRLPSRPSGAHGQGPIVRPGSFSRRTVGSTAPHAGNRADVRAVPKRPRPQEQLGREVAAKLVKRIFCF